QTAFIRVVRDEYVAFGDGVRLAVDVEDAADEMAIDRRVEEHRWRHDQAAVAVQDHAGEVARLANDGRIARAIEMIMHLIDQACDLVAQDLDGDGVHGRPLVARVERSETRGSLSPGFRKCSIRATSFSPKSNCDIRPRARSSLAGSPWWHRTARRSRAPLSSY